MSLEAIIVNISSVIVVIAGLTKNWLIAEGNLKPVYWLMIVMGTAGIATNVGTVIAVPEMLGILLFAVLNVWAVVMGIKGLIRLGEN